MVTTSIFKSCQIFRSNTLNYSRLQQGCLLQSFAYNEHLSIPRDPNYSDITSIIHTITIQGSVINVTQCDVTSESGDCSIRNSGVITSCNTSKILLTSQEDAESSDDDEAFQDVTHVTASEAAGYLAQLQKF